MSQQASGGSPNEPKVVSASWLLEQKYPATRWSVTDLIPSGLSVLVSPPKIGKSFFTLQTSFNIAHGTPAFWTYPTQQGEALYIDLELPAPDSQARLRKYISAHKVEVPSNLFFSYDWPTFDRGGLDEMVNLIAGRPNLRFIAIDVLAKLWPGETSRGNGYRTEYTILSKLKAVADDHNVSIMAVHHTNKMQEFTDPLHTVSGTNAMTGVPDCVMVVHRDRGKPDSTLFITGRKVRERQIKMRFDSMLAAWYVDNDPLVSPRRERANGEDSQDSEGIEQRAGSSLQEGHGSNGNGAHQGNGKGNGQVLSGSDAAVAVDVPNEEEEPSDQEELFHPGSNDAGSEGDSERNVGDGSVHFRRV